MTLVVSLLMAPAVIYLSYRLFHTSKKIYSDRGWLKLILSLFVWSFYLFPLIGSFDFYITGGIEVLEYPKPLTYWFWFGLIFVFQLVTWVLIVDVVKFASRFFTEDKKMVTRIHSQVIFILFAGVFIFTGLKLYHDTTTITTQEIELPLEELPEALHDFKIVHISDIQGDEYTGKREIARYIQKVNVQNPDLVIFTGDLISYGTKFIKMAAKELGATEATYGIVAVVGDHDFWSGVEHVEKALEEQGIPLLQDENYPVQIDSTTSVLITGVTEVYSQHSDSRIVDSLTSNAKNHALKIFASHQIVNHLITSSQKNNYNLMLAGHTHGGQIRVPFMGMSFSASERETEYVSGLYQEGDLMINVNNGLGFTLGPIRYNAPPMVSVIHLVER
jgi:predicted MPP superfamily phosphohydrolase